MLVDGWDGFCGPLLTPSGSVLFRNHGLSRNGDSDSPIWHIGFSAMEMISSTWGSGVELLMVESTL